MDDLRRVADALAAPDLSPDAVARGRHRLSNRMLGPAARRRRPRVLAAMLGLAATAAAAAVVVTTLGTTSPTGTPNGPPSEQSGRQLLLVAATTAASQPAGSGTYWYVKTIEENKKTSSKPWRGVLELWTRRDGAQWSGWKGTVLKSDGDDAPSVFQVARTELTYDQLQRLPATADGLTAWINNSVGGGLPAGGERTFVPDTLIELLYRFPAPPKVRAAAYRALAALPNVKGAGAVKGGRGLLINAGTTDEQKLVFDPKTSLVRSVNTTGTTRYHRVTVLAAEWTNTLPKVTPHPTLPPGRG
ncbi:CU044_5270 family protein [Spirillospora sp. NPDC048911]|uniref:CU044_5270 family protein n=1 Tax=Spirillospora sp. NPDC048911 TaxID=3364527 RepID=UPI0037125D11